MREEPPYQQSYKNHWKNFNQPTNHMNLNTQPNTNINTSQNRLPNVPQMTKNLTSMNSNNENSIRQSPVITNSPNNNNNMISSNNNNAGNYNYQNLNTQNQNQNNSNWSNNNRNDRQQPEIVYPTSSNNNNINNINNNEYAQINSFDNRSPRNNQNSDNNEGRNDNNSGNNNQFYGNCKMDGIYAQAFKSLRFRLIVEILIAAIQIGFIAYFLQSYIKAHLDPQVHMKLTFTQLVLYLLAPICAFKLLIVIQSMFSTRFAVQSAGKISHSVPDQPITNIQDGFQQCTSKTIYINQTATTYNQQIASQLKSFRKQEATKKLKTIIKQKHCFLYQIGEMMEFGMLGFAIYAIVMLAVGGKDQFSILQYIFYIFFIIYWMLFNYMVIACLILLVLSPLIITGICIYICISGGSSADGPLEVPPAHHPTSQQIIDANGSCTICMMNFSQSDNCVTFPCSTKHMFHELCINGWLNVKSTCPICRYDLRTGGRPVEEI